MAVVTDGHLTINKGEIVCLTGLNGSGKTTLAEFLAGFLSDDVFSGSLLFQGKDLSVLSVAERARQGLYVALQQVPEFEGVTAEIFLYEAYYSCHGVREFRDGFHAKLVELCAEVGLTEEHLERPLFKGFSGGERKRFQLLELLLLRPKLAIMDELDAGLDAQGLQVLFSSIKKLRTKNKSAFLVITHNQTVIDALFPDRCYELFDHKLRELTDSASEGKVL